METRFGHDFSRVRVHTDARAAQAAAAVGALAYTTGNHIVFAAGQYAPHTRAGRWLLAHELTHVVQQAPYNEFTPSTRLQIAPAGDHAEHEAQRVADHVTHAPTALTHAPAYLRSALGSRAHTVTAYQQAAATFQQTQNLAALHSYRTSLGEAAAAVSIHQTSPLGQVRRMTRAPSHPYCFVTRQGVYKTLTGENREDAQARGNRNVIIGPVEFCHEGACRNEGGSFPDNSEPCE